MPYLSAYGRISSRSSYGISGTITPSIPYSRHKEKNFSVPYTNIVLRYIMRRRGLSVFVLIFLTVSKILSSVVPLLSERRDAFWIVTPSAIGSENGTPSSIMSAPRSNISSTVFSVVSRSGSPAVTNVMSAFLLAALSSAKHLSIRLISLLLVFIYISPPFLPRIMGHLTIPARRSGIAVG